MSVQVLPAACHRVMPWKNGGGSTTEIAISPEGVDLGRFDWRISMARIENDGPFSVFPGIDRTLCVLDGDGLVLQGLGPQSTQLTRASAPFAFSADIPVVCALLGSAVTDLNVMTRRDRFRHEVRRLAGGDLTVRIDAETAFLIAITSTRIMLDDEKAVALSSGDAARFDGGMRLRREGDSESYLILLRAVA